MTDQVPASTGASPGSLVLRAIWRGRWLILVAALVAGVGGYLISRAQPESFSAQSNVVLGANHSFDPLNGGSYGDPTRFVANQVSILGTAPVLEAAVATLQDGTTVDELAADLAITAAADSDLIVVQTTAPTAEGAAARANAVVGAYRAYSRAKVEQAAVAAATVTTDPSVADQIRTQAAVYGDGVAVAENAPVPDAPATPRPSQDAAVLALLAAVLATGVAVWRRGPAPDAPAALDRSGLRVLGTVPVRRGKSTSPDPADFGLASVALGYALPEKPGPVLVTGVRQGAEAAAVAHGLAVAAAAEGRRVLLVDAEPRERSLQARLGGATPARDLGALTDPAVADSDVLVTVPAAGGVQVTLALLGAPGAALTGGEVLTQALACLDGSFDLVLVQAGPLALSATAFALLRSTDQVVAVADVNEKPAGFTVLTERLEAAHRTLTGLVLTRPARGRGSVPASTGSVGRTPSRTPSGSSVASAR